VLAPVSSLALGEKAPAFSNLVGTDGARYSLSSFDGNPFLAIVFAGNGCPTVKAFEPALIALQHAHGLAGFQLVALNSNNPYLSPPDTSAQMQKRAADSSFNFPYLKDEDRSVAKAYGALCTPHVFLFDPKRKLCYRGRIADSRVPSLVKVRDFENALEDLLAGRQVRVPETEPFGCAIVW
jgi:peroxiredoxin